MNDTGWLVTSNTALWRALDRLSAAYLPDGPKETSR